MREVKNGSVSSRGGSDVATVVVVAHRLYH